jgi:prepilin-type N-terminal cleavage/methylation domain-containing protein
MMVRRASLARSRASGRHGFTLVELLVAMAAGLMVSMAAFLLSKNATRFFQNEARVSAAHLAATLGLNRISADLQRAGLHSSPNVLKDPFLCGKDASVATWPNGMRRLAGIQITRNPDLPALRQSNVNNFFPDSLVIGGSMNTTEQFYFSAISCGPGGCELTIDPTKGAVDRTVARQKGGGESLNDIFRPGRLLRLQMMGQLGSMYSIVQSITVDGDPPTSIVLRLETIPNLPTLLGSGFGCGLPAGFGDGYVNPVSRVRYDIRSLAGDPSYGPLVAPITPELTGDNLRTELVRVELDAEDHEIPTTLELVAEYAVDLKFGITRAIEDPSPDPRVTNPTLVRHRILDPVDPNVYSFANANEALGSAPERIRAVQVRLSTRTRAPDRDVGLPEGPDRRKLRFLIPDIIPSVQALGDPVPAGAPPVYARMRTLYAEVSLPNQARIRW